MAKWWRCGHTDEGIECRVCDTLNSTQAHAAFEGAMSNAQSWAHAANKATSSAEFDKANTWRWRCIDTAIRAAAIHNPQECNFCNRNRIAADRKSQNIS